MIHLHFPHPRKPTLRGMIHLAGAFVFAGLGILLALQASGFTSRLVASIYALSIVAAMTTSAFYHRVDWPPRWNRFMERLDHSMIYVWIAATYTPILVIANATSISWVVLTLVWTLTGVGIVVRFLLPTPPRWVRVAVPISLGWLAIVVLPKLLVDLPTWMVAMIALGGMLYTLGAFSYFLKWPDPWPRHFGFHEVFHALVVAAAVCHYAVVYPLVVT